MTDGRAFSSGLSGTTVLVTGGSHGLGAAIVSELARRGCDVVFTYASSHEAAQALVAHLETAPGSVRSVLADATDFRRAHEVVTDLVADLRRLDVLVNNVGGAGATEGAIWDMTEEVWDAVIDLNLKSCFNYTHAVAPVFIEQRRGTIVNIGSINGLRGRETQPAYTAAKAGMLGFTKTIAKELGRYDVNVNLVATGYIGTDKQIRKVSDDHRQRILSDRAMAHLTEPEEVARAVAFLCGDEARYMTGSVLKVDAGEYI